MLKYIGVLMVALLAMGAASAQLATPTLCEACYANIITQEDIQVIDTVKLGMSSADPHVEEDCVGNEGLSAAIIVTPKFQDPANNSMFAVAPFARIDQFMSQTISNLGTEIAENGEEGAKGLTWNKAIQAAWIANQGLKERENLTWVKEGSYISQSTTQVTNNVYDYDSREGAKILNLDNKVAMIVDDLETVINLTANANTSSIDSQTSIGAIENEVNVTVRARDPP